MAQKCFCLPIINCNIKFRLVADNVARNKLITKAKPLACL
jgi:hypothetical protein